MMMLVTILQFPVENKVIIKEEKLSQKDFFFSICDELTFDCLVTNSNNLLKRLFVFLCLIVCLLVFSMNGGKLY